jgi:hypothetical protein
MPNGTSGRRRNASARHYLRAVDAANSLVGLTVMRKMKEMPIDDFYARGAKNRLLWPVLTRPVIDDPRQDIVDERSRVSNSLFIHPDGGEFRLYLEDGVEVIRGNTRRRPESFAVQVARRRYSRGSASRSMRTAARRF